MHKMQDDASLFNLEVMDAKLRIFPSFLLLTLAFTIHHGLFPPALGQTCNGRGFACVNCNSFQRCNSSNLVSGPVQPCPVATICSDAAAFECTIGSCSSCTSAGRFPDASNSAQYFICSTNPTGGFDRIIITCPAGFLYSSTSEQCDIPVTTTTTPVPTTTVFPCVQDGRFPDATNCSRYYMCKNKNNMWNVTRYTCPGGSVFSFRTRTCVLNASACTPVAG
ncbi:uncharacterized protein LOC124162280 [Ischnura elegans]|uniref:uncharacterized protein LOC124162280 n=1 Tax=Ischnura elegans TaxID=197161 RepID=UPI001ED8B1DA|nr:uncharacterized protein LOC124162280 [Ischnura elegans]